MQILSFQLMPLLLQGKFKDMFWGLVFKGVHSPFVKCRKALGPIFFLKDQESPLDIYCLPQQTPGEGHVLQSKLPKDGSCHCS